ncbi:hypothetical protein BDC45DRAFT_538223 [Circinella umbellata]|nr:hypothetical protein BDC45DRAFT_538223 [Circinella umbellata]
MYSLQFLNKASGFELNKYCTVDLLVNREIMGNSMHFLEPICFRRTISQDHLVYLFCEEYASWSYLFPFSELYFNMQSLFHIEIEEQIFSADAFEEGGDQVGVKYSIFFIRWYYLHGQKELTIIAVVVLVFYWAVLSNR